MSFFFVDDQPSAARTKWAQQSSKYLFVECNEHNGRVPQQTRALRKGHIMRNTTAAARRDAQSAENSTPRVRKPRDSSQAKVSEDNKTLVVADHVRRSPPPQHAGTGGTDPNQPAQPAPLLQKTPVVTSDNISPFASVKDVTTTWQWFFYGHDVSGKDKFNVARWNFMEKSWKTGCDHEIYLNSLSLYARRKRIHVAGDTMTNRDSYLQQKGQLVRMIQAELNGRGTATDMRTLRAIAILGYCHLQDKEPEAVGAHFAALRSMNIWKRATPHDWLLISWMDLRLSLGLGVEPMLAYYIPTMYRVQHLSLLHRCPGAIQLASHCSQKAPISEEHGFSREQSLHLFLRLFQLTIAWPQLRDTRDPPYGHLYDLEYNLRLLHARVSNVDGSCDAASVELLLIAMQLHVWFLARIWTPIAEATRACVLRQARILLEDASKEKSSPIQIDSNDNYGLSASLWILSTIATCAIGDRHEYCALLACRTLEEVILKLAIYSEPAFLDQLRQWPWIESWHTTSMPALWRHLENSEDVTSQLSSGWWNIQAATVGPKSFGL